MTASMPRGPRDTRSWYRDVDALEQVDDSLVEFVAEHGGPSLLDLGCGLGGYSKRLAERGFEVVAFDVSAEYVERARTLGVDARHYDGERLTLHVGGACRSDQSSPRIANGASRIAGTTRGLSIGRAREPDRG